MAIKKKWYEIVAPKMLGEKIVGETLAVDPKYLVGRIVNVSLPELEINSPKFYIKLQLQVDSVDGTKAYTKFMGHDVARDRISRVVQRHSRRVDCIQDIKTKDGDDFRVKTVAILIKRVGTSKKNGVRTAIREFVKIHGPTLTTEELIKSIIDNDFQKLIKQQCAKIYPVGTVEIRKTQRLVLEPKKKKE